LDLAIESIDIADDSFVLRKLICNWQKTAKHLSIIQIRKLGVFDNQFLLFLALLQHFGNLSCILALLVEIELIQDTFLPFLLVTFCSFSASLMLLLSTSVVLRAVHELPFNKLLWLSKVYRTDIKTAINENTVVYLDAGVSSGLTVLVNRMFLDLLAQR